MMLTPADDLSQVNMLVGLLLSHVHRKTLLHDIQTDPIH